MEAFSYSVSHDLRAPLRNITGFIELLARRSAAQLDGEANHFLTVITTEATRMGMLIDDLLAFSRIGRAEMKRERVDLAALCVEVCVELGNETAERKIEWRIGPLPAVRGDRALLRQVVVNLLGNAVKFSRRREVAVIEVGATRPCEGDAMVAVHLRDNGAGFNPRYLDKLFGVFWSHPRRAHQPSRLQIRIALIIATGDRDYFQRRSLYAQPWDHLQAV